jgi:hypothetical protein
MYVKPMQNMCAYRQFGSSGSLVPKVDYEDWLKSINQTTKNEKKRKLSVSIGSATSRVFSTHSTALTMPTSVVHALGVTASALAAPTVAAPGIETTVVEAPVVATFALEAPGIEATVVEVPEIEATMIEDRRIEAKGIEPTGVQAPVVDVPASVPNPVLLTSLLAISVLPFPAPVAQSSVLDIHHTTVSLLPSSVSQPPSL